jgi:hypothetical protein
MSILLADSFNNNLRETASGRPKLSQSFPHFGLGSVFRMTEYRFSVLIFTFSEHITPIDINNNPTLY